jgi:hypothetical protein
MNRNDIKKVLNELTSDLDSITDKKAVAILRDPLKFSNQKNTITY